MRLDGLLGPEFSFVSHQKRPSRGAPRKFVFSYKHFYHENINSLSTIRKGHQNVLKLVFCDMLFYYAISLYLWLLLLRNCWEFIFSKSCDTTIFNLLKLTLFVDTPWRFSYSCTDYFTGSWIAKDFLQKRMSCSKLLLWQICSVPVVRTPRERA